MSIWAHTLVKNEQRYLWYAVAAIVGYVDKVLLWDTGSTDDTVGIIKELVKVYPEKIDFSEVWVKDAQDFPKVRQEMLSRTKADWILMVDGDEVWWEDSIKKVTETIESKKNSIESIVVPMIYPIGDIYHRQEEKAGKYNLVGKKGHFALRGVSRNIPGLTSTNPHGTWGWTDGEGKMIQDRSPEKILYVEAPYLHFSLLERSMSREDDVKVIKRARKFKYELGNSFPKDFYYPEVFFRPRPKIAPSPWIRMDTKFFMRAAFETPLRKIKRRVWQGKVGY